MCAAHHRPPRRHDGQGKGERGCEDKEEEEEERGCEDEEEEVEVEVEEEREVHMCLSSLSLFSPDS